MAMNFFEHQDVARRKSGRLVMLFVLAVVSIVAVIYAVVMIALGTTDEGLARATGVNGVWNPYVCGIVTVSTLSVIVAGSLFKTIELAQGGERVALLLGGRRLDSNSKKPAERRLLNVVEEIAIASGVPVPSVYVLDRETSINAFAAGWEPTSAVIGVTRGTLEYLNRDELQGVIAHEFSHILNGDMRLNIRLIGLLNGILIIALIGYYVLRFAPRSSGSSDSKKGNGIAVVTIIALSLVIIGYVGVFFGKLIKAAVSRQREYLADASAVQFTRNPEGIAGALKKIGGVAEHARIADPHAEEASHMFFGDALEGSFLNLFSTHPPLAERIKRIDPAFNGRFPRAEQAGEQAAAATAGAAAARQGAQAAAMGFAVGADVATHASRSAAERSRQELASLRAQARNRQLDPTQAVEQVGTISAAQLDHAAAFIAALPAELDRAAREPHGAQLVVYALLVDRDEQVRGAQLKLLESVLDGASWQEFDRLLPEVDALGPGYRMPLLELAQPALKALSARQYDLFRASVERLVKADEQVDLAEYVLWTMIVRHLDQHFGRRRPPKVQYQSLDAVGNAAIGVLATLAHVGHHDESVTQGAFEAGMQRLGKGASLPRRETCTLAALDRDVATLAASAPQVKRQMIEACVATIAADGLTSLDEAELLRALCDALGCPMPPLVSHTTA
ncbi:MAG: M48 family metallopeptidase [Pirellulales bacterium]|nr:M48 family metallopeptidase [Pirellulales bacterium]